MHKMFRKMGMKSTNSGNNRSVIVYKFKKKSNDTKEKSNRTSLAFSEKDGALVGVGPRGSILTTRIDTIRARNRA
ncbi:hypothetical protein Hdeb2414_s0007g00242421 [Helianthus debilis subsp. tardiflorus]